MCLCTPVQTQILYANTTHGACLESPTRTVAMLGWMLYVHSTILSQRPRRHKTQDKRGGEGMHQPHHTAGEPGHNLVNGPRSKCLWQTQRKLDPRPLKSTSSILITSLASLPSMGN